jgi:hypothetical protein
MTEKPEIISGLKNSIERGYSLELSMQSFINAGYSRQDVQDSARALGGPIMPQQPISPINSTRPLEQQKQQLPQMSLDKSTEQQFIPQQARQNPMNPMSAQTFQRQQFQIQKPAPIPMRPQLQVAQPTSVIPQQMQQPIQLPPRTLPIQQFNIQEQPSRRGLWLILLLSFILLLLVGSLGMVIWKRALVESFLKTLGFM